MLKINLIPQEPSHQRSWLVLALAAVVLAYGGWWWLAPHPEEVSLRPMQTEEKETVIATLEHLQIEVPRFARWVEEIKEQIDDDAVPCLVQDDADSPSHLVSETADGLVFSGLFFDADTVAQENALLSLVSGNPSAGKSDSNLAVVK